MASAPSLDFPENQLGASLKVAALGFSNPATLVLPREPTRGLIEGMAVAGDRTLTRSLPREPTRGLIEGERRALGSDFAPRTSPRTNSGPH